MSSNTARFPESITMFVNSHVHHLIATGLQSLGHRLTAIKISALMLIAHWHPYRAHRASDVQAPAPPMTRKPTSAQVCVPYPTRTNMYVRALMPHLIGQLLNILGLYVKAMRERTLATCRILFLPTWIIFNQNKLVAIGISLRDRTGAVTCQHITMIQPPIMRTTRSKGTTMNHRMIITSFAISSAVLDVYNLHISFRVFPLPSL